MTDQKKTISSLSDKGFSLMEMMIVIAIIGLIGSMVTLQVMKRFDEAKISATKTQIRQLGVILQDFRRVCGYYPTTEQGLDALAKAPVGRECKNYDPEGFLKKVPKDAWDNDFMYVCDGNKYTIRSLGSDRAEGGTGVSADISSDELE
ncbi:MAG: type II secretion system major pseudopilin GspG [Bdellovibrionota bacterium]